MLGLGKRQPFQLQVVLGQLFYKQCISLYTTVQDLLGMLTWKNPSESLALHTLAGYPYQPHHLVVSLWPNVYIIARLIFFTTGNSALCYI